jgi:SAM-dependent methyltransferase
MARFSGDIRGTVLEIGDNTYTRAFGCGVGRSEVLDVRPEHTGATITADLSCADQIPSDIFDCIILTQTLQYIYDTRSAIRTIYRILRPGGVVLATFPGISQIAEEEMQYCGDYWRFTGLSARRLFEETFAGGSVEVATYGNVFAAIAFLHGLAVEELRTEELDTHDPQYELLISVRAVKPGGPVG